MTETSSSPLASGLCMPQRHVLVAGATGRQGGAIARGLLRDGHVVRGLTRNPGSPAARALDEIGASVVAGDLNEPDSLAAAVKGASTVVVVTTPYEEGADAETRHGLALVDAAMSVGIEHFVFNSVKASSSATSRRPGCPTRSWRRARSSTTGSLIRTRWMTSEVATSRCR